MSLDADVWALIEDVCQYSHVCPHSNYGNNPECAYDYVSCPHYKEYVMTLLKMYNMGIVRDDWEVDESAST